MPDLDDRDGANIEELNSDFYAGLLYLCLHRLVDTLALGEAAPSREKIRDIINQAYVDLEV